MQHGFLDGESVFGCDGGVGDSEVVVLRNFCIGIIFADGNGAGLASQVVHRHRMAPVFGFLLVGEGVERRLVDAVKQGLVAVRRGITSDGALSTQ